MLVLAGDLLLLPGHLAASFVAEYMIPAMRTALSRTVILVPAVVATILLLARPAAAKSYSAERFDSIVRVLSDGTLDVTETVVFRFEDGTFREVFREIPKRFTDGIEVVSAGMQGQRLPFGTEPGTAEVRERSNRVRVVWRFSPTEGVTRAFTLNYRVRGGVRQEDAADVIVWRGTPGEHQYRIDASTMRFELPVAPRTAPDVRSRRTQATDITVEGRVVQVRSSAIGENGWIDTTLLFPRGAITTVAPAWQQHAAAVAAQSGQWMIAAGLILSVGLIVLLAWRQSYDPPPSDVHAQHDDTTPRTVPDSLAPAIGGILASGGHPALEHAMASLFAIADRGDVEIREQRGTFGQRDFLVVRRGRSSGPAAGHEQTVLDIIFRGRSGDEGSVRLGQARSRLTRRFREFSKQVMRELADAGLLDAARKAIRTRYNAAGVILLIVGGLAAIPAAWLIGQYGGWPLLIPAAIGVIAIAAFIFGATITPLSNDGVRRSARWRAYRKYLTAVARDKQQPHGVQPSAVLPFAVALGLAGAWSKFLKRHGAPVPAWFHAEGRSDAFAAFPAFIATGGSGGASGAGGGHGGAAGGGASGAH